jgi:RNase P subunit RPR2
MKEFSKTEAKEKITDFFNDIENKSEKDVKKIKKLAMSQNIQLKESRKKFCKKCYSPLKGKTRINNKIRSITCERCGNITRWKLNN